MGANLRRVHHGAQAMASGGASCAVPRAAALAAAPAVKDRAGVGWEIRALRLHWGAR